MILKYTKIVRRRAKPKTGHNNLIFYFIVRSFYISTSPYQNCTNMEGFLNYILKSCYSFSGTIFSQNKSRTSLPVPPLFLVHHNDLVAHLHMKLVSLFLNENVQSFTLEIKWMRRVLWEDVNNPTHSHRINVRHS